MRGLGSPTVRGSFGALALGIALLAAPAGANVSLKNGNFFVGYTDAVAPGGLEMKVERVYNSKTDYRGLFGNGWGFEYGVFVTVRDDGAIVVHEYGGGADNVFAPAVPLRSLSDIEDQIMAAADKTGRFSSDSEREAYRKTLDEHHADEWTKLQAAGVLSAPHLPVGTTYQSRHFSLQSITRTEAGYVRRVDSGRTETYDLDGHLRMVSDANNNSVTFAFDDRGYLKSMTDNFGHAFLITVNDAGLITKLVDWRGKVATYGYRGTDLVRSTDTEGNTFRYAYDQRFNLLSIGYSDKTSMQIAYYGPDLKENVKRVVDRDGTITTYRYVYQGNTREDIFVKVTSPKFALISSSRYTYFFWHDTMGDEHTRRLVTTLDGDRTDTTYNDDGYPVIITSGDDTVKFAYDAQGRVTKRETATSTKLLTYQGTSTKVSQVVETAKGASTPSFVGNYQWDTRLNLVHVTDSTGDDIALTYDDVGRILTMNDKKSGAELTFTYNDRSKPVTITLTGTGTITVTYDANGEIKNVASPEGRKVALQVTASFQHLLDAIRPAGVDLSL